MAMNNRNEAIKIFEKALLMKQIKYQDMMECVQLLGIIYAEMNQNDKAFAAFNQGLQRDPANAALNRCMGNIYASMNKKSKALAHWYISLSSNPDQPELLKLFNKLIVQ